MSDDDKKARDFTKDRNEFLRVTDWREDGLWVIIYSLGGRNFCTYIGIPVDHPLAGFSYEDLPSIDCHGGLTYAQAGEGGKWRPEGYYWYGWDYAHAGDKTWYGDDTPKFDFDEKDWTLKEVKDDAWSAIYDFKKLRNFAEKVAQSQSTKQER